MKTYDHILLWMDLETTGLDLDACYILEVGWAITDLDMKLLVGPQNFYPQAAVSEETLHDDEADEFVCQMHSQSGLWKARTKARKYNEQHTRQQIARYILNDCKGFLPADGGAITLAGGGVSTFDMPLLRRDYPSLVDKLTYYTMDFSVVERYLSMRTGSMRGSSKSAAHRVVPDILYSMKVAETINKYIPIETCIKIMEELHDTSSS